MDSNYTFSDLKNINKFIDSVRKQAKAYNIKFNLTDEKYVKLSDNIKCSGYFDERWRKSPGEIIVATNKSIDYWLSTLVHEASHMQQWIEQCDAWVKCDKITPNPTVIDDWLDGKDYSKKTIEKAINITRDMELDCEKRTVVAIRKYKLPINIGDYIQKANIYMFFHNYLKTTRRWSDPKNNPYTNPNIYKLAKRSFYDDYSETPKEIWNAFKKYKI